MINRNYHIKPYLRERGFNLTALALRTGMSFQRFDHHIKLKKDLSYNFVKDLSIALGMSIEEFIDAVQIKSLEDEKTNQEVS